MPEPATPPVAPHVHPADHLGQAIADAGSPVCVGLDPVIESIPEEVRARHHEALAAVAEFCRGVLHAVAGVVPAVKFQSACFERYGGKGVTLLEDLGGEARRLGMVVIWDAKRGDIGISSEHYAAAAKRIHAHYITVSGYMGESGIEPFLNAGLGVFVLVRTSNPDSDGVQGQRLTDGRSVAEMMAERVAVLGRSRLGSGGLSDVGAVVGATKAAEGMALRARMPDQLFLIPGYGAQGGTAADIRGMMRPGGGGVLITSSRGIIYAKPNQDESWTDAVQRAAKAMAAELAPFGPAAGA